VIAASIVLGALVGAVALPVGLRGDTIKWRIYGALLLTVAICSHHFTAMGAVSDRTRSGFTDGRVRAADELARDRRGAGELRDHPFWRLPGWRSIFVTGVRVELETDRMRGLANAAVEGLIVCDGDNRRDRQQQLRDPCQGGQSEASA